MGVVEHTRRHMCVEWHENRSLRGRFDSGIGMGTTEGTEVDLRERQGNFLVVGTTWKRGVNLAKIEGPRQPTMVEQLEEFDETICVACSTAECVAPHPDMRGPLA